MKSSLQLPQNGVPRPALPRAVPRALGALRHRNYRLFFGGQLVSTLGTWMQDIALSWLALQLTHSPALIGLVLAAKFTPMLFGGPLGGLVADRFDKRRVLLVTQCLFAIPAAGLFMITVTGTAEYWMVVVLAFLAGTVQVFDVPARQAFVIEMVGRDDLLNAIALNSAVWNASSVVGPAIAGLVIAGAGVAPCFAANALSYIASVAALLVMRNLPPNATTSLRASAFDRIREGFDHARRDPVVGTLLLVVGVFSMFAMNRLTLLPVFADTVLKVGARGYGFMLAASGAGAVLAAVTLAVGQRGFASGSNQFAFGITWVASLLVFSQSRSFGLSLALLTVTGFCQIAFLATANTRIQVATPDALRGRVMALYGQSVMGVGPVGSLQAGAVASIFGAPVAMVAGALVAGTFIVGARLLRPGVFARRPLPPP